MASNGKASLKSEATNDNRATDKASKGRKSMGIGRKLTAWFGAGLLFCALGMGIHTAEAASSTNMDWRNENNDGNWNDTSVNFQYQVSGNNHAYVNGANAYFKHNSVGLNISVADIFGSSKWRVGDMQVTGGYKFTDYQIYSDGNLTVSTGTSTAATTTTFNNYMDFYTGSGSISGTGTVVFGEGYNFNNGLSIGSATAKLNSDSGYNYTGKGSLSSNSNAGIINKTGVGEYNLENFGNQFKGAINVTEGILGLTTAVSGTDSLTSTKITVAQGADLNLSGLNTVFNASSLTGKGNVIIDGLKALEFTTDSQHDGATQVGAGSILKLKNAGSLSKSALELMGELDITGVTSTAAVNDLTGVGNVSTAAGKTLSLNTANYSGIISGDGGVTVANADNKVIFNNVHTYEGETKVKGNLTLAGAGSIATSNKVTMEGNKSIFDISGAGGDRTIMNLVSSSGNVGMVYLGDNDLTINATNTGGFYGKIISNTTDDPQGDGGVIYDISTGQTYTLYNANEYSGDSSIKGGGTLEIKNKNALPNSKQVNINSSKLKLIASDNVIIQSLYDSSANKGTIEISNGNLVLQGAGSDGTMGKFYGSMTGAGGLTLDTLIDNTDTFTLDGVDTAYTGATTINKGELVLLNGSSLSGKSNVSIASTGALDASGNDEDLAFNDVGTLSNAGTINLGTHNLVLNNSKSNTNSGTITGGKITVKNKASLTNTNIVSADVEVETGGFVTNNQTIDDDVINHGTFTNGATGIIEGTTASSGTFHNYGKINSATNQIGGKFTNYDGAVITGKTTVNGTSSTTFENKSGATIDGIAELSTGQFINSGKITAGVNANSGAFTNSATGEINGGATLRDGTFSNSGLLEGTANVVAGTFTNSKTITGPAYVYGGKFINNAAGTISGVTTVTGGVFENSGAINNNTTVTNASFTNKGGTTNVISGTVDLTNGSFDNAGTIKQKTTVHSGTFSNSGTIEGEVKLDADNFTNTGTIKQLATIDGGAFTNNGQIQSSVDLNGGTLDNTAVSGKTGSITGNVNVKTGGKFTSSTSVGQNVIVDGSSSEFNGTGSVGGKVEVTNGGKFIHNDDGANVKNLNITGAFTSDADSFLEFNALKTTTTDGTSSNSRVTAGSVDLKGDLAVNAVSGGTYNLVTTGRYNLAYAFDQVTGKIGSDFADMTSLGTLYSADNSTATMQIVLLKEGQYTQSWTGAEDGNWDVVTPNWSLPYNGSGTTGTSGVEHTWQNNKGGIAEFGSDPINKIITVGHGELATDNIKFDTLKFDADGYVLSGGNLEFAPAGSGTTATISANAGRTVINANLVGNGAIDRLLVTGGKTLALGGNNNYAGGTRIEAGTRLELLSAGAAGSGDITLASQSGKNNVLAIGHDTNTYFTNKIVDGSTARGQNTVEIMEGSNVTFGQQNNYYAKTEIMDGAILNGGSGTLSQNSVHTLYGNGQLNLTGTQTLAGLVTDSADSTVNLGTSKLILNSTGATQNIAGKLIGDSASTLLLNGNNATTIGNISGYNGAFAANSGSTLNLTDTRTSVNFNLASIANEGNNKGTINLTTGANSTVNLGGQDNGATLFGGNLNIANGTIQVADSGVNALRSTNLKLGANSDLVIDRDLTFATLDLAGRTAWFEGKADGSLATLTTTTGLNGGGNLILDSQALMHSVGQNQYNFFKEAKEHFIYSPSISGEYSVKDDVGTDLKVEHNVEYFINQGGTDVGKARATGKTGVDQKGMYYQQSVYEIEATSGHDVTINSDDATPVKIAGIPYNVADLNAHLTGDGGFKFTGTNNIFVDANNSTSNPNNYKGVTTIAMASDQTRVVVGDNKAFGNTSLVDLQMGYLDLNGKELYMGGLSGKRGTTVHFSSGLNINTHNTSPDVAIYDGLLEGTGFINKTGTGTQNFTNTANALTGNISLDDGAMTWFGKLLGGTSGSTTYGDVNVNHGGDFTLGGIVGSAVSSIGRNVNLANGSTFTALNSSLVGGTVFADTGSGFIQHGSTVQNAVIKGVGSYITGSGNIQNNLDVIEGATYLVGLQTDGNLDETFVGNTTNFDATTNVKFSTEALAAIYKNPNDYSEWTLINSKFFNAGGWTPESINMGLLGTIDVSIDPTTGNLMMDSYNKSTNAAGSVANYWSDHAINIGDVVSHSNVADVDKDIITTYMYDPANIGKKYVNTRFANAYVAGGLASERPFSNNEIVSLFNYQSGLSAAIPVDAAMDVARNMIGRGLQNRITSLRAGRDTFATTYCPTQNGCYAPVYGNTYNPGYGFVQPQTTYATTSAYGDGSFGDTDWSTYGGDTYVPASELAPVYPAPAYGVPGYTGAILQQPALALERYRANRVWASGIGDWIKHNTSDGGIGGFTHNAGGIMLGYDHTLEKFTIGAALAYTHGKLDDKYGLGSDSKMDSYAFTAYGDYNFDNGMNLGFYGGYELFDNKIDRNVASYRYNNSVVSDDYGREHEKYKSDAVLAGLNLSKDFVMNQRFTLTPSIGVTYTGVRSRGFDRVTDLAVSGTHLTDSFDSVKKDSLQVPLEVAGAYDVLVRPEQKLTLMANAGYAFECINDGAKGSYHFADVPDLPKTTFNGREPGRSNWNLGVGARYQYRNIDFDLRYDFTKAKDSHTNRLGAAIGIEF